MPDLICSYYTMAGVSPAAGGSSPRPFAERVKACAQAGYAGIGVHVRDYRALREQGYSDSDLRAIVADAGLRHVELEFLLNWFADGEALEQSRRDEETLYHMADVFGARVIFLSGDISEGNAMPFAELADRFARLSERAAKAGALLGVEPCAWSNVGTVDEALRLVEVATPGSAGLFLDIWHLCRRGFDYQRLRALDVGRILGVQINDAAAQVRGSLPEDSLDNRLLPGRGTARTAAFVQVLLEIGVTCPFSVEVISDAQRGLPMGRAAQVSHDAARAVVEEAERNAASAFS